MADKKAFAIKPKKSPFQARFFAAVCWQRRARSR
jgi:hypothetical protein